MSGAGSSILPSVMSFSNVYSSGFSGIEIVRIEAVYVGVLGIEKEQLGKIVPGAVKDTLALRDILSPGLVEAGRPFHCPPVFVVRFVAPDVVDHSRLVESELMQPVRL